VSEASPAQVPRHPVIVGYDGSAAARHALVYAAGVARRIGRSLLVVYVAAPGVNCVPVTGQPAGLLCGTEPQKLERWLLAELDQVAEVTDLEVRVHACTGSPARELAAMAVELSADALVIGAPAHFWRRVAGSVPGRLVGLARCTVIVVP
jgi:nucleotide-binding universal stress UspA family protein